jgi:transposase-like protein
MSKRRHHTAEFKAKVALDALKGIEPVHVIAARYGVHPTQVTAWKKEIADRLPELFGKKTDHDPQAAAEREEQLYKKIGQLQVQVDWGEPQAGAAADAEDGPGGDLCRSRTLSRKHPYNPVYPYLLRRMKVERPNQVWAADITYVPIQGGFIYLCAVMDWYSRAVLAWELSNTLDAGFCARARAGDRPIRRPGDLQHGPGQPVYLGRVYPAAPRPRDQDLDGRPRPRPRQRLRRTALAHRQVRRDLPEELPLPDRRRHQPRHVLPLLQRPSGRTAPPAGKRAAYGGVCGERNDAAGAISIQTNIA